MQRGQPIPAAAGAHEGNAFFVDAPVPQCGGDDNLIEADDGQHADLLAAQLLRRAQPGARHDAISVLVKVSADDEDVGAREVRGDVRLRRDDVKLDLAAGERQTRFRAAAEQNRLDI